MVMIFQSEKARKQLMEKGFVFTFRYIIISDDRKLGKDWITDKRCGKKIADVIVSLASRPIFPIPMSLIPYVFASGFDSVEEWVEEIKKYARDDYGEIYCVVKI